SIFTSIVVTNVSAYNDRFLYVPVLGIIIAVVDLLRRQVFRLTEAEPQWRLSAKWARQHVAGLLVVAVLCGLAVWQVSRRLPDWKDRYALFEKDVQQAPTNARLLKNYGGSLARLALDAHRNRDYAQRDSLAHRAIEVLQRANDRYEQVTGLIHLGNMYMLLGRYDEAEPLFDKALQRDPDNRFAKTSLANIYRTRGEYERARALVESIPMNLRSKNDHLLLSLIYDALGDAQKAQYYRQLAQ
ncbi:MAG: tetratricopeptide repeat protein, partial [Bacteroidetes bacterium]